MELNSRENNRVVEYPSMRRWEITGLVAAAVIVLSVPLYVLKTVYFAGPSDPIPSEISATFIGREKCTGCHKIEYDDWLDSHHDKALDVASETTVLGDFNDSVFEHDGFATRFYQEDDRFFVHTQGPDGAMGDFEVTHVIGVYPLQQYMVPFPGGRLQCLTTAWDDVKKEWYLLPNHISDPEDWLHWTKAAQNWNGMCAECHSTHLQKGYDFRTDNFNTTWSEIDVSCEACHGPGSHHVEWAEKPDMARPETPNFELVVKTRDMTPREQLELCARCHARRTALGVYDHTEDDIMDHMIPQLLREGLYYPDGQILEEVYVYGSFIQSKMYQRGVRCGDCHNVHSLKLLKEGNDLCLQCHHADIYDTKDHHFHKKVHEGKPSEGDDCVLCHMPGTDYMGIDNRADHSIRVPRPDLSVELGTPNACNVEGCHPEKSNEWSADHVTKWYGIKKKPHYGMVIAAGREGRPEAQAGLIKLADDPLYPPVVRSTALSLLRFYPDSQTERALDRAISDVEPLVRHTAISVLNQLGIYGSVERIVPLLYDPVGAVRGQAALSLSALPPGGLNADQERVFETALAEYRETMEYSADFSFGRYNLGNMYTNLKKYDLAEENFKAAIDIDEQFYLAKYNLAMLYNQVGRNRDAEALFQQVIAAHPDLYEAAYSLGLLLVEMERPEEGVVYLERAAAGMPGYPRVHYNLGLLQQQLQNIPEAEFSLLRALELEPDNMDYLYALADFYMKRGKLWEARGIAEQMAEFHPSNPIGRELLDLLDKVGQAQGTGQY